MRAPGRLWLLYWPAGLAAGGIELALVLTSNHKDRPGLTGVLDLVADWSFIGSDLVTHTQTPRNPIDQLMIDVGFAWFTDALK